jgi:L-aminopeptidase/D-esterase-like protein
VIEILAAATGASITVAAMGLGSSSRRNNEGREAVIRLTEAVNTVANRLDELHVDLKADRRETFSRLNDVEQRIAKLEARL